MKKLIMILIIVIMTWGIVGCYNDMGMLESGHFSIHQTINVDNNYPPSGYIVFTVIWENFYASNCNIVWSRYDTHVEFEDLERIKKEAVDEARIARGMMYAHDRQAKEKIKEISK